MPDPRIWPIPSANDVNIAVGLASGVILAANPNRVDCDITNYGAYVVWLARGNDAVVGVGLPLMPRGGSYHIGVNNLFLGIVNAIAEDETFVAISEGTKP